ncbi:hypothetical protein KIW84_021007 [Lathyrus oleraceus]|uniref:Uncharacterized protein n=1 Tax=Pisum sativum TaxID=3888 RepID=A0A9D5B8Q2_PEA|nr:hypothetical protein KIW84_021007 [Pisum sativum]
MSMRIDKGEALRLLCGATSCNEQPRDFLRIAGGFESFMVCGPIVTATFVCPWSNSWKVFKVGRIWNVLWPEEVVRSEKEKEKLRVVNDESVVSKVQKERGEDPIFISKRNGRVVSYVELVEWNCKKLKRVKQGREEVEPVGKRYEAISEDIDWVYNGLVDRIRNDVTVPEKERCSRKSRNRKIVSSVLDLKRVARLSNKYRYAFIHSLKGRTKKKTSSGSLRSLSKEKNGISLSVRSKVSSLNEDWKNWMALHGKPQEVVDDVCEVVTSIRLKVKGD